MLKSWSIQNFKAIVDSGNLKLAPITVLAGRNSSGKSSLLQSILMISQTLSSRLLDRPLLPNGPIVQLGTLDSVITNFSIERTITIGFELNLDIENNVDFDEEYPFIESEPNVLSTKVKINFNSANPNNTVNSALESAKVSLGKVLLEVVLDEPKDFAFSFIFKQINEDELSTLLKNVNFDTKRLVPYGIAQPNYIGEFEYKGKTTAHNYLLTLSHFLPTALVRKFNEEDRRKQKIKRVVNSYLDTDSPWYEDEPDIVDTQVPLKEDTINAIQEIFTEKNIHERFTGRSLMELSHFFQLLMPNVPSIELEQISFDLSNIVVQDFLKDWESDEKKNVESLELTYGGEKVSNLLRAVSQTTNFFASKIRYLGPLRADPQASQKFAPSSELDDVGSKGEYAAAVYDANQNALIDWYNPLSKQVEQGPLKKVLNAWADYLGVANRIEIETAGQSGFSWQVVHREGRKPLPLSAVGVGVSQILPILVMGLLSPKGSLLIIEQPELHLHARVQALLGDFFVGLSKCNKQCLIETHSENLVSQLRLHIVQSGGLENSDCMIYFVDQDEQGAARFEEVKISKNGNILNWPDGFFDETMHQENRITAASVRRRAKLAEKHA